MGKLTKYLSLVVFVPSFSWAQTNSDVVDITPTTRSENKLETTIEIEQNKSDRGIEKVEVTGSHIRRTDIEGPSPVVVIDRAQIEASGFNDVGSLLRASTATPFGGNGNTVSLRGLGSARTLILIDGHRAPKSGSSYGLRAASANFVPLAAVDRIEILRDGASATYGSDALGGVVNIITRKNLDGFAFNTKYDISEPIGGDRSRTSVAYASQSSRSSFLTSFQYTYDQGTRLSSFKYRDANTTRTSAPNYLTATSGGLKAGANCAPTDVDPETGTCIQDTSANVITLPGHEVGNVTTYSYEFSGNTEFFTTFVARYSQDNSESLGSGFSTPGVGSGITFVGADAQKIGKTGWAGKLSKNQTYTNGDAIRVFGRLDNGRRTQEEDYMGGLIVGSQGYWGESDWAWKVALNNQMFVEHSRRGDVGLYQETQAAILNQDLDPFSSLPQSANGLTADSVVDSRYQVNWLDVTSTGDLGNFAGASWSTAIGVSGANFEYKDDRDDRVTGGSFMGLSGVEGGGERQLYAGFMELAGTFGSSLETQIALRQDQYSDFGNTFNPKVALLYKPLQSLAFRGSAGTGFNAPSLQDTYGPRLEGFYNGIIDTTACNAAGNNPNHPDCRPNSFSAQLGANPDLKQETSFNYNLGVIIEPIKRLSFSIDYWAVKIDNTINSGDPQKILELEAQGVDVSKYGATIERNPNDNSIDRISLFMANAGSEEVDGVDVAGLYTMKTSVGDFNFSTEQTYMFNYYQTFYDELGSEMVLGQGGLPRWRNVTSTGYRLGGFSTLLTARTTSRVEKSSRNNGNVEQFTQFDLNFDYAFSSNSRIQLGAINVFDQRPALDETTTSRINTSLYRPFRTTYLAYRQDF